MSAPRLLDAGEAALVVEFGDRIDEGLNARVVALDAALGGAMPAGIVELVPTYRSLMIHYDPLVIARDGVAAAVAAALETAAPGARTGRRWRLPACYDADLAEDLPHVATTTGLAPDAVIRLHAGATYRVFMYGFAPGWAYLGGLPAALALPRRATPRDRVPGGSLLIAGGQAIIAGGPMPSGWHILGRTPEAMFAPARNPAFLLAVGDLVTFDPVDRQTLDEMDRAVAGGAVVARAEDAA